MTTTPTIHVLRITDRTGDTAIAYSPTDELTDEQVRAAFDETMQHMTVADVATKFDELIKAGFLAYTEPADGSDGDVIRSFDPDAGTIRVTPPLVGG